MKLQISHYVYNEMTCEDKYKKIKLKLKHKYVFQSDKVCLCMCVTNKYFNIMLLISILSHKLFQI